MTATSFESRDGQSLVLGAAVTKVADRLEAWCGAQFSRRLWAKDHTLFAPKPQPELEDRLGWLNLPLTMRAAVSDITAFAAEVKADGIRHIVLLGMGGSSLAPEVFQRTFGNAPGYPALRVLDSTHPAAVRGLAAQIDLTATLFVVSSKSGTTLETLSYYRYFWSRLNGLGVDPARHFVAISDPGTPLIGLAHERGFRRVFEAQPDIGGRYSALTHFGLVPAALIGVDLLDLLDRAATLAHAARSEPETENSALALGAALGELALTGRDKVTYLASPALQAFPVWVEQLIAESTGKDDKGIVPVADEPAAAPDRYADDRFFIYLHLGADQDPDAEQARRVDALEAAGHPVARILLESTADVAREMYRAELAVAAAGVVLGIHPFNQPDVELAKDLARQAMAGNLSAAGDIAPPVSAGDRGALCAVLDAWLASVAAGDYIALHAYLPATEATTASLQSIRLALRDRLHAATTLGYGPRFLHSTGQLHKGGANNGLFLQLLDEPDDDLAVPESDFAFGDLIAAQAEGDFQALSRRGRRVLRVQLGQDVASGLATLGGLLNA